MNTKTIKFDLNKFKLYEKIKAKQGDTKSRFLLFQLLDGSAPFNLKNRSVRAYMIKPDGKEIFNDLIVNNYNLGYCTLELTNQVLAVPGTLKIELMVTEGDKKLTSSVFELEVVKSINSEKSIVSTNEFTALLNGLAALSEYDNYKNSVKEMEINKANKAEVEEKFISVEEKIKNNSEQLEQKAEQSEVNKRLSFRNFEPIFGYNCYWGEIWGTDGTHTQKNRIEIGNDIKQCEELGIDEITVDIHIGYNSNTSALYIATNMDDVLWAITTFSDLNVKIKNAKIHVGILEDYLKNTITLPVFLSKYKNIVFEICDKLKNTTIENITVLNECSFIDTDTTYTADVIELLNIAKNKGYKVGITCAGIEHNFNLPTTVIELSDLLCVNCYPTISFKKEKTTYEDSINAWKQHEVNMWIETRKKQYPNKKIIISETGVTNCWEALLSPASNIIDGTLSNKATEVYLKGVFEVLNKGDLDCVWWWFGIFTEGTNIQKMFDYELRGIINE